jgi:hypothetical protein
LILLIGGCPSRCSAGGFAEFRYLALERTSNNPLSVMLAFEPNVRLIDETSGERVHNYEFETTVNADIQLLRNRLYAGFNLLYEPEVTWTATDDTIREATLGGSAALSLRITPNVLVGGEVWYLRHYDSPALSAFTGDAIMLGLTMYVQFTPKMFMIAAWNAQVWGREVGNSLPLNLSEFQRQRARLKFASARQRPDQDSLGRVFLIRGAMLRAARFARTAFIGSSPPGQK